MKQSLQTVLNGIILSKQTKYLVILLIAQFFAFTATKAAPYYWIGGSGNWNDLSHWASTSNGPGFAYIQAPTQNDDVYFDQNSFTGAGQTITVNVFATCRNIDFTGATNTYSGPVNGPRVLLNNQWDVLGNFVLAPNMKSFGGFFPVRFIKDGSTINIDTKAVPFSSQIILDGLSTFQLQSSLTSSSILLLNRGKFNSNNYSMTLAAIRNSTPATFINELRLGASNITLTGFSDVTVGFFYFYSSTPQNANLIVDATSCNITLSNFISSHAPSFTLQNFTFNKIISNISATVSFNAHTTQPSTIRYLKMSVAGKAAFLGLISIKDTLELAPGGQYGVGNSLSFQNTAKMIAIGSCNRKIEILPALNATAGTMGVISKVGGWGSTTISNCIIQGIDFSGGGNITANQSSDLGNNVHINFTGTPQTYYWVGGTGNWHVGDHWAATSGGVPSGCIPGPLDNVVFDANSFSGAGQLVYLNDSLNAWCANMTWASASNSPQIRFVNTGYNGTSLYITGSATLNQNMNWNLAAPVNFIGTSAHTINSKGQSFKSDVAINAGSGTYSLGDSLVIQNGKLCLNSGSFVTNNNRLNTEGFLSISDKARTLNLGSSYWTVINKSTAIASPAFSISGTGIFTLNAGTSAVHVRPAMNGYLNYYLPGSGLTWYAFYIENNAFSPSTTNNIFVSGNNTFDTLYMERGTQFGGGNTYKQALVLGQDIFTSSSGIQTFAVSGKFLQINPNCANYLSLQDMTFKKNGGGVITIDRAKLQNIAASGGIFSATNSFDLGGNNGWTFTSPSARTLYWVGNSGNWSDPAHWSLVSGGAPGQCMPNAGDDVFFDGNSFSTTGQAVTIDITNADCKNMSWATVTNAPALNGSTSTTVSVYGSLTLNASIIMNTSSQFVFCGNGANQITSSGKTFKQTVVIKTAGSYTLTDDLNITRILSLEKGTFNSNNKKVTIGVFYSTVPTVRTLTMGSSQWVINGSDAFLNAWVLNSTNFTLTPGTSQMTFTFLFGSPISFSGGNVQYNKVIFGAGTKYTLYSGNFKTLKLLGTSATLSSSVTNITDTLQLTPGAVYTFAAGSTVNFAFNTVIMAKGTNTQLITMQSSVAGSHYNFIKPSGLVCADFMNLYDSWATGGAIFTAGANTIDRGGNNGWDFAPYPQAGNGVATGGIKCAGAPFMLRFDLSAGAYPMQIILRNLNTGQYDTLNNVTSTPVYFAVSPLATNNYRVEQIKVMRCDTVITGPFNTVTVTVPVGTSGVWTNLSGDNRWLDCRNWGNGTIPDSTTDVLINIAAASNIDASGAYCRNLTVNGGSTLSLTAGIASLSIHGSIVNTGTFNSGIGKVTLAGANVQSLPANVNTFDSLVIDNRSATGVNINSSITVNGALRLSRGKMNTGVNTIIITNNAPGAVTNHSLSSYINGNLRRNISNNGSYDFPVGTTAHYELAQLDLNNLAGINNITTRFNNFSTPATDTVLNPNLVFASIDTAKRLLNYGYWTITPNLQPTSGNYNVTLFERGYTNPAHRPDRYIMVKRAGSASPWDINLGSHNYFTQTESGGTVKTVRSTYTSFSDFAIAKLISINIVPVRILSFTGRNVSTGVNRLSWKVVDENEVESYVMERSDDGIQYTNIGNINSLSAATGVNSYSFDDKKVQPSINFYRLKVMHKDGHFTYSNTVSIDNSSNATSIQVLTEPNVKTQILIRIKGWETNDHLSFNINDIQGRHLQHGKVRTGDNPVAMTKALNGTYVVKIYNGTELIHVQKILFR